DRYAAAVALRVVFAGGFFAAGFAVLTAAEVRLAAGFSWPVRTPSSHSIASSSERFFAYISSEARIFFALTYICFSPVESPFAPSRSDRLRTTSASSKMSPVFLLSRLCLKRRFQFFGISVPPEVRYLTTFLTASSSMTFLRPTSSAFSAGTFTVMSLCRILIVRYSRFSPRTSRFSRFTTVPAPWCGYTTLSPTLYKLTPSPDCVRRSAGALEGHRRGQTRLPESAKKRHFCRGFGEKSLLRPRSLQARGRARRAACPPAARHPRFRPAQAP